MNKARTITLWIATVLCAAMFLFVGIAKFANPEVAREAFEKLGYADWFRVVIAVLEITGAILLLAPRAAWVGSGMLAIIMVGAIASLVRAGEYMQTPFPAALFVLLAFITYLRRPSFGRQTVT